MFVSSAFQHFLCTLFVFLHCMFEIFKIVFCMLEFFLAFFPFYKKTKNIFWVLKSFGKNNLDIFSSKLLAVHHIFKELNHWGSTRPKGGTRGPTLGPADPIGRPTQGQRLLGPTFSNSFLTVVPSSSLGALAQFPSNRGRERGDELSCSLSPLSLPLTHSCSGFLWILTQVWLQEHSLSLISLLQDWSHIWRNNFWVRVSFSFH